MDANEGHRLLLIAAVPDGMSQAAGSCARLSVHLRLRSGCRASARLIWYRDRREVDAGGGGDRAPGVERLAAEKTAQWRGNGSCRLCRDAHGCCLHCVSSTRFRSSARQRRGQCWIASCVGAFVLFGTAALNEASRHSKRTEPSVLRAWCWEKSAWIRIALKAPRKPRDRSRKRSAR